MIGPDQRIREKARSLGFERVAVASAVLLDPEYGRYEAFIDAGKHGEMSYLATAREARQRLDTDAILEGARSIVCVAESYAGGDRTPPAGEGLHEDEPGVERHIAQYARGSDYHNHLRRRLRRLAAFIRTLGEGVRARPICDDAPVLERAWAARSGLGFVGKNGLVIAPGLGSFILLGEVVTTLDLRPDVPMGERCGSCTLCLDACPTDAFDAPFVLDARRCISYLTIELRGPMPEDLRASVGEHLFGCDVCQDVCPYNKKEHVPKTRYLPLDRWKETSLQSLTELASGQSSGNGNHSADAVHADAGRGGNGDAGNRDTGNADAGNGDTGGADGGNAWDALSRGSPVRRAMPEGLARNAITVLANRRHPRYRAILERAAQEHPDAAVREHAAWGLHLLDKPCND